MLAAGSEYGHTLRSFHSAQPSPSCPLKSIVSPLRWSLRPNEEFPLCAMASADVATALEAARRAAARWGPGIFDDLLATLGAHSHEHTALGASPAASVCSVVMRAAAACAALAWVTGDGRSRVGGNATPLLPPCAEPLRGPALLSVHCGHSAECGAGKTARPGWPCAAQVREQARAVRLSKANTLTHPVAVASAPAQAVDISAASCVVKAVSFTQPRGKFDIASFSDRVVLLNKDGVAAVTLAPASVEHILVRPQPIAAMPRWGSG